MIEPRCLGCGEPIPSYKLDFCFGCINKQFMESLESAPLAAGTMVNALFKSGHKDYETLYWVVDDFNGGWHDDVNIRRVGDNGTLSVQVWQIRRDKMTNR